MWPPSICTCHLTFRTITLAGSSARPQLPSPHRPANYAAAVRLWVVADTGVDALHPDLKSRLTMVVARGRPGDPSDLHGHGTHVAGSLAGDGSASGGVLRGVAAGVLLFFQSLMDAQGRLTGLPVDLNDLLAEAYEAGVRIHNNSWGADATSVYRMSSLEPELSPHLLGMVI